MMEPSFDRKAAISLGWRQCSIFNSMSSPKLYNSLPAHHKFTTAFYMVLSHPCSLLNANLESEPTLEYVVCQPIDKINGNSTFGKNPRVLHIDIDGNNLEVKQKDRGFICKSLIDEEAPAIPALPIAKESLITRWMANRYITTALPDQFEERLGKQKDKLSRAFNNEVGKACKSVYINLNEFILDLSQTEDYKCILVFMLNAEDYEAYFDEEDNGKTLFNDFLKRISVIFSNVEGITLTKAMFVSEKSFTVHQMESGQLKRWQFDYISIAKGGSISNIS